MSENETPMVRLVVELPAGTRRVEPNPILVAFREETDRTAEQAAYWAEALSRFQGEEPWSVGDYMDVLEDVLEAGCTPEQIEDARKVLTRLVGVFG